MGVGFGIGDVVDEAVVDEGSEATARPFGPAGLDDDDVVQRIRLGLGGQVFADAVETGVPAKP